MGENVATASVSQFFTNSDLPTHVSSLSVEENSEQTIFKTEDPDNFFEISETITWVQANGYKRVALQFPDSFLFYAGHVSDKIAQECNAKTFILADTSYRSCCVDFVAAAHASCDSIVHYGNACLSSPSTEIPVKFVLGRLPLNVDLCVNSVVDHIASVENCEILLLSDAPYNYCINEVACSLHNKTPNTEVIECPVIFDKNDQYNSEFVLGRQISAKLKEASNLTAIFIGSTTSSLLPIWMMTFPQISTVISFDPKTNDANIERSSSIRQLRKRLFLVEKLKDANTVGLIVGTVGLEGHRDAVKRMRHLCKAAGKKMYVISVGKVNVPKLSNFSSDIDAFVLVSCPFGILLDTSDYYKPVLSLFEAEVALNPSNEWAAGDGWTADFSKFLHDKIGEASDESDLSLLTGKIRSKPTEVDAENEVEGVGQVALYTAGDYFKLRSWRGLDDSVRTSEDTCVSEGRSGIASTYDSEPARKEL